VRAIALLGAVAGLGVGLACERGAPPVGSHIEAPLEEPVVSVETARVRRGSILQRISAPGTLVAHRESRIGPEVAGRIERIFVEEGDRIEAGDPLFQIDREPYELALRQAQARRDRALAEHRQLDSDLERARRLRREDVLADQDMEQVESALAVARSVVREASEAVALAERNLDRTLVRAPYAGSIAARLEDEGTHALVQPQTLVVVVQEAAELEARAAIPEVHFAAIGLGDPALLHVEGLAAPIRSEVSAVSDTIDPATRTYGVRMRVPNEDYRLKAGVFARVEILPRAKGDVLLVPRSAVRREDGRTQVLAVRDGRAVAVPVQIGIVAEDAVELLGGVRVDDEVIVGDAAAALAPGMRVRTSGGGPESPAGGGAEPGA
jgi:membrane fusion protein (multidrug efflux system)